MNQLIISSEAIASNLDYMKSILGSGMRIMPMVKANGYGVSAIGLSRLYEQLGIDILGVAYTAEAVELRKKGTRSSIFILHPRKEEAKTILRYGFEVAIQTAQEIDYYRGAKLHLHINTGMNRLGCDPNNALGIAKKAGKLEGVMTHFCDVSEEFTLKQAQIFFQTVEEIETNGIEICYKHGPNSPTALQFRFEGFNLARLGLSLFNAQTPALTLLSKLVDIHPCKKGDIVSYGGTYKIERETERIGVIPIGYHDGIHRSYRNAEVDILGKRAPIAGTICMDFTMVSLAEIPEAKIGDMVTIFGPSPTLEEFAKFGHTIPYELIACLGPRIKRIMQPLRRQVPLPESEYALSLERIYH